MTIYILVAGVDNTYIDTFLTEKGATDFASMYGYDVWCVISKILVV